MTAREVIARAISDATEQPYPDSGLRASRPGEALLNDCADLRALLALAQPAPKEPS
jgi:hypothetical protein